MSFTEKYGVNAKEGNGDFELLEDGIYEGYLASIQPDEGIKYGTTDEKEPRLRWNFETSKVVTTKDTAFRLPYWTSTVYTMHPKNKMRIMLEGLFGKTLSVSEFNALKEEDMVGKPVSLWVEQYNTQAGKTYNRISKFKPLKTNGKTQTAAPGYDWKKDPDITFPKKGENDPVLTAFESKKILPGTIQSINDLRDKLDMTPKAFYEFLTDQLKRKISNIVNITEEEGKQVFYLLEAMVPMEDLPEESTMEDANLDISDVPF
jgi:hypothetical protein